MGRGHNVYISEAFDGHTPKHGRLQFTRIKLDAFIFHQVAGVLVMQGMTLQDLFPPDAHFLDAKTNEVLVTGPFVFLKGDLSEGWDPPLRLKDVTLAVLEHVPEGMAREEVLAFLLKEAV